MFRRIGSLGLILTSVLAITVGAMGALPVAPASARCFKVIAGEVSSWGERGGFFTFYSCKKEVLGKAGFTKVVGAAVLVGTDLCFKVQQNKEESGWEDAGCTKALKSTGKYIKVNFEGGKETDGEPGLAPEATEKTPTTFTSIGKVATFETKAGTKLECTNSEGKGSMTGPKGGTSEVSYTGCNVLGLKCNGLGSKEGAMLLQSTLHLWYGLSKTEGVPPASVLLLKELHIECPATKTLITIKGCVAGALSPNRKLTKALTATFKQEKGVNDITEVVNESDETIPCIMLVSINGAAFEQAGAKSSEEVTKFKQGEKETEVEIIS
jgi:hypothetical protein